MKSKKVKKEKIELSLETKKELADFNAKSLKEELLRKGLISLLNTSLTEKKSLEKGLPEILKKSSKDVFIVCGIDEVPLLEKIFGYEINVMDFISISYISFKDKIVLLIVDPFFPMKQVFVGEYNKKSLSLSDASVGPFPIFFKEKLVENYINKRHSFGAMCIEESFFNKVLKDGLKLDKPLEVTFIIGEGNYSYRKYTV